MTFENDLENNTNASVEEPPIQDEQTPLLDDISATSAEGDGQDEQPKPPKREISWYLWRMFWFLTTSLVLAVFIKGWIDAGSDVDVSF